MRSEDYLKGSNYEERSFELLIFVASKVVFSMKVTSLLFSLILYGYNRYYLTLFFNEDPFRFDHLFIRPHNDGRLQWCELGVANITGVVAAWVASTLVHCTMVPLSTRMLL